jgi:uncharacterized protein (DUF58 family)
VITRRFVVLPLAGVPLLVLLPAPWLVLCAVLGAALVLALADLLLAAPVGAMTLRRDGDRSVWLGESATVSLTVGNTSARVARLSVRDTWVPSAGATPDRHDLWLDGQAEQTITTTLTPTRHGDRPAVRVSVRSYGPLRLAYRQRPERRAGAATPPWRLRVLPRFPSRRILPEKVARLRMLDGAVVTKGRGQGTEFDALREYVLGDDVRSLDWRASARRHEMVVRTWRPERDRRVLCILDTGRTSAIRIGDEPRLDATIDAALLLASLASRADDRVDLLAVDSAVRARVDGGGHRTRLPRLIESMAPLEPALVETDFNLVVSEVLRKERKRSLVVLFTALDGASFDEGLLPVLPRLAARHRVVVATVADPSVTRLATLSGAAATADAVYTAAAAQKSLNERARVQAALGRLNVTVIDAARHDFASRVADVYLTMKATGRL